MPELPEAEANRARVAASGLNRTIEGFDEFNTRYLELPGSAEREALIGRQFTETRRHGKMIFMGSATGPWLAVHLGMTGRLFPIEAGDPLDGAGRLVIRFEGERRLVFRCHRKFGWARMVDRPDDAIVAADLGPDALTASRDAFVAALDVRQQIKAALLDQTKIAGLGNLWSDEVLFQAGIAPDRRASEIDLEALHGITRAALRTGCEVGADYDRLPRDWLLPRREEGADCPRCGGTIVMRKVGGRAAHYCPEHQR